MEQQAYQKMIQDIVDQALLEKTFSLEIINKIKDFKDVVDILTIRNKELEDLVAYKETNHEKIVKDLSEKLHNTTVNLQILEGKAASVDQREKDVAVREKQADKLEYTAEFQKQRGDEIKEMFMHVFRNPVLTRNKIVGHPSTFTDYNGKEQGTILNSSDTETEEIR